MRKSTPRESSRFLNDPIVERVSEALPCSPLNCELPCDCSGHLNRSLDSAEIVFENCLVGPVL